jgi:hypothetical protein
MHPRARGAKSISARTMESRRFFIADPSHKLYISYFIIPKIEEIV